MGGLRLTAKKPRRDVRDQRAPNDKRISLAPLDFEQALGGILAAGPHPKDSDGDDVPESVEHHHEVHHKRKPSRKAGPKQSDAP